MSDYAQQTEAGEKSGLVRAASGRLAHLLSGDIDTLLDGIGNGLIGGIRLSDNTVQTILERAATSAIEINLKSRAYADEQNDRHQKKLELETMRQKHRLEYRNQKHNPVSMNSDDPSSDCLSVSALMAREGTQEEIQSQIVLSRPPAHMTLGDWFEVLSSKQRRIVRGWFEDDDITSASEMDARYVFDNMSR